MGNTAIIIGAGPAGLTAAYELLSSTDLKPIVCEATGDIGGLSKTMDFKGNRMDIGGHRFFSKSARVMKFWLDLMPLQGAPAKDDVMLGRTLPAREQTLLGYLGEVPSDLACGPDPEKEDGVMLLRHRVSRILFRRRFFDYPLSLSGSTLRNLGIFNSVRMGMSYVATRVSGRRQEKSLEDFLINRFGKNLYKSFFKDYTEKVWGLPCREISAEWGAQRIKGLSIRKAVAHAAAKLVRCGRSDVGREVETSLIEQFLYPKLGPGQLWERLADIVQAKGGEVRLRNEVVGLSHDRGRITSVSVRDARTGVIERIRADCVFSTMPVKDLIASMAPAPPRNVGEIAAGLRYRDFITVGLLVRRLALKNRSRIRTVNGLVPDNWIYIQEPGVKIGRLQVFNNWSPYMVADEGTVWLGLEYFCNEGDALWSMEEDVFKTFAVDELVRIGLIGRADVLEGVQIKITKTYPAYFGTYDRFHLVREWIDGFENLFLIGRNGMHRYNNQDHSMLTAMLAVENVVSGVKDKSRIWSINTDEEYHEAKSTSTERMVVSRW